MAPIHTALGVLGMPGMTAYCVLLQIGGPGPGETVVVAAASRAVGSALGRWRIGVLDLDPSLGAAGAVLAVEALADDVLKAAHAEAMSCD